MVLNSVFGTVGVVRISNGFDEIKLPNPFSHLPLAERCTAYENLIKSSKNKREQDRYKQIYGEECLAEYQHL